MCFTYCVYVLQWCRSCATLRGTLSMAQRGSAVVKWAVAPIRKPPVLAHLTLGRGIVHSAAAAGAHSAMEDVGAGNTGQEDQDMPDASTTHSALVLTVSQQTNDNVDEGDALAHARTHAHTYFLFPPPHPLALPPPPPLPPLSLFLSLSLRLSLSQALCLSRTLSLSFARSLTHTHTLPLTQTHTHAHTHTNSLFLSVSVFNSLTHSLSL